MTRKLLAIFCIACFALSLSISALAQDKPGKPINGIITDDKCSSGPGAANADCAKRCLENGAKAVLVTDSDKSVLEIDNPSAIKGHEGQHVAVIGSVSNNTLHVDSVKPLSDDKSGK
jgi:hypothetical protein